MRLVSLKMSSSGEFEIKDFIDICIFRGVIEVFMFCVSEYVRSGSILFTVSLIFVQIDFSWKNINSKLHFTLKTETILCCQ